MPPPDANAIKAQLKTLLDPVIGTAATKKTKIIASLEFAFKEGDDPTNLRSELDPVTLFEGEGVVDRVNCLMISEAGFTQSPSYPDDTRMRTRPRGRLIITRRFRLTQFYQMGEGSENEASSIIEIARVTLNQNPKLGFAVVTVDQHDGPGAFIDGHDGLQMSDFVPEAFGMTLVHVGDNLLTVRVIEPQET